MKKLATSPVRQSAFAGLAALCASGAIAIAGEPDKKTVTPVEPEPAQPWRFNLSIPGWLAATSGTTGLNGLNSHIYLGADSLIKHLDMAVSFSAEARKDRFGIYGDLLYVSASDGIGSDGLIGKFDVRIDEYIADLELNYRLLEGPKGWLDVRAGVRYTNMYDRLTISPNDYAIEQASNRLVDAIAERVRERVEKRLGELDLKSILKDRIRSGIESRLGDLAGKPPTLPEPPLGGNQPGIIDDAIRAAISAKVNDLAAALRAQAEAKTDALKAEAQSRINALKKRIANRIADVLKDKLDNSFSLAEQWWDPYVGLGARYNLSKAWYLTAKGDIGGFGVGSELTWQAYGALGCQISRYISLEAGYRYLYTDYNRNGFLYDVTQSGAQITLGVTF